MAACIKAGLVGVTGYTGMELARILANHPQIQLVLATSRTEAGARLKDIYPFMRGMAGADIVLCEPDPAVIAAQCALVFLAVPHRAAMEMAASLRAHGVLVVDLSADFRLRDATVYMQWYKTEHTQQTLLCEAVYGLVELYADQVRSATLVANPGCYPTCSILSLYPAVHEKLVHLDDIVIDAKSGTSGAGRKAQLSSLFCEVHDNFKPYGLASHRHTPEIEQELSRAAGEAVTLSFNPHLLPIDRGIETTIYTRLRTPMSVEEVHAVYSRVWGGQPWIRVLPLGSLPETRNVRGTMFCDIGLTVDPRTGRLIITACIDNLCRGASGQAVANANLMCGLPLDSGLANAPFMP